MGSGRRVCSNVPRGRVLHESQGIHRDEHAADHVVDAGLRDFPCSDRVLERLAKVEAYLELLIQACQRRFDGAVRGACAMRGAAREGITEVAMPRRILPRPFEHEQTVEAVPLSASPQSDMSHPSKPRSCLRMEIVAAFSHEYVPLIRLYEHTTSTEVRAGHGLAGCLLEAKRNKDWCLGTRSGTNSLAEPTPMSTAAAKGA